MRWIRKGIMFCLGGSAYVGLELLYRGRSHSSMFAAGGLSFLLLGKIREKQASPAAKAVLGMGAITAVELATGLLVNRNYTVWDYRQLPYNFRGQICPFFMLLWLPLAAVGMGVYGVLDKTWDVIQARNQA